MRIAALIATEFVSGPGRQLAALAAALQKRGVAMRVMFFNRNPQRTPPFAAHLEAAGVAYDVIIDRGPLDWRMATAVEAFLLKHRAELVQTHGYKATALGFALRNRTGARPWIACYHGATTKGLRDRLYQQAERWMLSAADRVVVVSTAQTGVVRLGRKPPAVIDNAMIPLEQGGTAVMDEIATRAVQRPRLGVIARLSAEKGVDVFLHACAILRSRDLTFSAVVVGEGSEMDRLVSLSAELQLGDRVHFTGHIPATAGLYSAFDVVVIPSRSEGLPNVLLEAVQAGRRVVATAVGAVPEVLSDPAAGRMVPPEEPHALAEGIAAAMVEPVSPAEMRARDELMTRYSLDARVARHLRLYEELVGSAAALEAG